MRAAVVTAFDRPPACVDHPAPLPDHGSVVVDVVAAGLHPRVRSQASGTHYTSTDDLPLVPGIDGVGRDADGRLRYFVLGDTTKGSMAEQTAVDERRSIVLPDGADPVQLAAAMNPAMSAWVALRRRIDFEEGSKVVVIGATGNAGSLAVQVAKRLGAREVVAVGRDRERLAGVGADRSVLLADSEALGEAARDADVVIDYVWGVTTADALRAIVPRRADDGQKLTWIQVGSVGGLEAPIPSAALRATRLEIVGSGQGAVSPRDIVAELPHLVDEIGRGTFRVDVRTVPLAEVDAAWAAAPTARERLVIVP